MKYRYNPRQGSASGFGFDLRRKNPDPIAKKKTDPDPTLEKKTWIRSTKPGSDLVATTQ